MSFPKSLMAMLLWLSMASVAHARTNRLCSRIFTSNKGVVYDVIKDYADNSFGADINSRQLTPDFFRLKDSASKTELPNRSLSKLNISRRQYEILLANLKAGERVLITPLGVSVWPRGQLEAWLKLDEMAESVREDPGSAENIIGFVSMVGVEAFQGISTFWMKQLVDSSRRVESLRKEHEQNLLSDRNNKKEKIVDLSNFLHMVQFGSYSKYVERVKEDNSFEFPWGETLRGEMLSPQRMDPNVAPEVMAILMRLTLIENTVIWSENSYTRVGEVLDPTSQLMVAVRPELFPLVKVLKDNPATINPNQIYKIGFPVERGTFFRGDMRVGSEKAGVDVGMDGQSISALFTLTYKNWIESGAEKILVETLDRAIREVTNQTRRAEDRPRDVTKTYDRQTNFDLLDVKFEGLSLLEASLVVLRLKEQMDPESPAFIFELTNRS